MAKEEENEFLKYVGSCRAAKLQPPPKGGGTKLSRVKKKAVDKLAEDAAEQLAEQVGAALPVKDPKKLVKNLSTTIKRYMNEDGTYKSSKTYQVEAAASTLLLWRKIRDEALQITDPTITETSRESDSRMKLHPLFQLYVQFTNLLRHDLRALALNFDAKSLQPDEEDDKNDALASLMKRREEDEDDD